MRHTGHKPYRCAHCDYTAIQAISLKTHVRSKHPAVTPVTSSLAPAAGGSATAVYSCQSCSYQTVNRRSWLGHLQDHRNDPPSVTAPLFVIEEQNNRGQLVLAPLLNVAPQTVAAADPNPSVLATSEMAHTFTDGFTTSQSDTAQQMGLRHIVTAISEQCQDSAALHPVIRYNQCS